jgi:hypothetical protein
MVHLEEIRDWGVRILISINLGYWIILEEIRDLKAYMGQYQWVIHYSHWKLSSY